MKSPLPLLAEEELDGSIDYFGVDRSTTHVHRLRGEKRRRVSPESSSGPVKAPQGATDV